MTNVNVFRELQKAASETDTYFWCLNNDPVSGGRVQLAVMRPQTQGHLWAPVFRWLQLWAGSQVIQLPENRHTVLYEEGWSTLPLPHLSLWNTEVFHKSFVMPASAMQIPCMDNSGLLNHQ